jgi:hypothetical protein
VRSIAYRQERWLRIRYAEYKASCGCCKYFRTYPAGIEPKAKYDNLVRQAVLDRLLEDKMSAEAVLKSLRRDFLLELSPGFVYDCLHDAVAKTDMAEHRRWVLERFSGTLSIDELHLGAYTLLLATDPLGDFPVAFALVGANDQDHMRRWLGNLKQWGLEPEVVITDGSNLYPSVLAELWPNSLHQLCVFHVMADLNQLVLDALGRQRRGLAARGRRGRKRRGRPRTGSCRTITLKEQAHFVFKHRYLITRRRSSLTRQEKRDLRTMLEYLPALATLRKFVDALHRLFDAEQSPKLAWRRRDALARCDEYLQVPELAKAIEMLRPERFCLMVAFLERERGQRLRTNNHVERCNRKLRYFEKARYRWRRRRSIVRFLILALDHWYRTCRQPSGQPGSAARQRPASPPQLPPHQVLQPPNRYQMA